MTTTLAGIGFGLGAAVLQSFSYIFSRRYLKATGRSAAYLLSASHVVMGVLSLAMLPFLWSSACPRWTAVIGPVVAAAGFYAVGQLAVFAALRHTEASRIAPLLGVKIVVLAVLSIFMFDERLGAVRWLGVGLAVVSAFLLNEVGGRMPWRVVLAVLLAVTGYSLSDVNIKRMVIVLVPVGARAPWLGACFTFGLCGIVGAVTLCFVGWPDRKAWGYIVPHAATWFFGLCCLFSAFAMVGVVLGGIAQSTRGIISIVLAVFVARLGHHHLEQHMPRGVFRRRILAAALMLGAIVLYSVG